MQVQSLNNTGNTNSYKAKMKIDGHIQDIPQELRSAWKQRAKAIGTESDVIILHFEKEMSRNYIKRFFLGLIPIKSVMRSRAIYAVSNINKFDRNLSYTCKSKNFDSKTYITNAVDEYMKNLSYISDQK